MNKESNYIEMERIVSEISNLLNIANVHYLVYGSFAYSVYIKEDLLINDIDIMVSQKDFNFIVTMLKESGLPYTVHESQYSLHVNHNHFVGYDGKPFDISLDSYQKYFSNLDLDFDNCFSKVINGVDIKFVNIEDLIKIYEIGSNGSNGDKIKEYKRKVRRLLLGNS